MQVLLGPNGLVSTNSSESQSSVFALETAMKILPESFFSYFLQVCPCNLAYDSE